MPIICASYDYEHDPWSVQPELCDFNSELARCLPHSKHPVTVLELLLKLKKEDLGKKKNHSLIFKQHKDVT